MIKNIVNKSGKSILMLCILSSISGCAVVAVGAIGAVAGTTAAVATDPRDSGIVINDNSIQTKLKVIYANSDNYPDSNIYVNCYDGSVLLTGQVNNTATKQNAEFNAKTIPGVKQVYDYLEVRLPQSLVSSADDSLITTKIKAKLMNLQDVQSNDVKIITTDKVVYLFGIVTPQEGKEVADVASQVSNVNKVITLFEYVSKK